MSSEFIIWSDCLLFGQTFTRNLAYCSSFVVVLPMTKCYHYFNNVSLLFIPKGGYASDLSSSRFAQNIIIMAEPLCNSVVIAFNLSKQFMEKGDRPSRAGTGKYVLLAFRAEKLLLEFRIKVLEALQLRHQDQDIDLRLQKRASMRAFRC
jgi:hypothetical protein